MNIIYSSKSRQLPSRFTKTTNLKGSLSALRAVGFLLLGLTAHELAAQSWTNTYRGISSSIGVALALDKDGNVCVTGNAAGPAATIKYSAAGAALWTNFYPGIALTHAITADSAGNWYVTGYSMGIGQDYVTIKYSANGSPVWTNRYNGPGNGDDDANAICVDSGGNVYVTGNSTGSSGYFEYATIKYSSTGSPVWTNRYNGPGNETNQAVAMALDGSGNIYVTGRSMGSSGYFEYATIKYASSGMAMWTNRYSASANGDAMANAIALDSSGNVCVTGGAVTSGGQPAFATVKYSSAGVLQWISTYIRPGNTNAGATAITVDASGSIIVTGVSSGNGTGNDYATISYSSAGSPLWTNLYNGVGNSDDHAFANGVDGSGNVFVTGYSTVAGGTNVFATIGYSKSGLPLWTNFYDGQGSTFSRPFGIAVGHTGNVYVTGESILNVGRSYVTIKYATTSVPLILGANGSSGFSNGHFGCSISGPVGSSVVIQASTDLKSWAPLQTNVLSGGTSYFSDPQSSRSGVRFYRGLVLP